MRSPISLCLGLMMLCLMLVPATASSLGSMGHFELIQSSYLSYDRSSNVTVTLSAPTPGSLRVSSNPFVSASPSRDPRVSCSPTDRLVSEINCTTFPASEGLLVELTSGSDNFDASTVPNDIEVYGYRNLLTGEPYDAPNVITTGSGADWIRGGGTLHGGDGDDDLQGNVGSNSATVIRHALFGDDGNDTLYSGDDTRAQTLNGGRGNDTIYAGLNASDTIDCGPGNDTLYTNYGTVNPGTDCENIVIPPPAAIGSAYADGSGAPREQLYCEQPRFSGQGISFSYQWLRDGAVIPGETGRHYNVLTSDLGHRIACRVTATNGGGSAVVTSDDRTIRNLPPNAPSSGSVQVTGTLTVGETLTCTHSSFSGENVTYTYQWYHGWYPGFGTIPGATSATYRTQSTDIGQIGCLVTATNDGGSISRESSGVRVVTLPLSVRTRLGFDSRQLPTTTTATPPTRAMKPKTAFYIGLTSARIRNKSLRITGSCSGEQTDRFTVLYKPRKGRSRKRLVACYRNWSLRLKVRNQSGGKVTVLYPDGRRATLKVRLFSR